MWNNVGWGKMLIQTEYSSAVSVFAVITGNIGLLVIAGLL